jgi:polar amino acid transport system substrate-binding protein
VLKQLLAVVLFAWGGSCLAGGETINVDEANPPFMYAQGGQPAGLYPAIAAAAFRKMGVEVQVATLPWKRALQAVDEGRAGVLGIYRNAQREKAYDFSEAVFIERILLCCRKSRPHPANRVADLKGLRVGVILGWSYGDEFDEASRAGLFAVEEVGADLQNLEKLQQDRLDAALVIAESKAGLARRFPDLAWSGKPLLLNATYLAFSKRAGKAALLRQFDGALDGLRKSGELARLVQAELAK